MKQQKIAIASDHGGFELKRQIIEYFKDLEFVDFGTHSTDSMDYPDVGFEAARAVSNKQCAKGILVCGSGIGMSIVANKVANIRAALCYTRQTAQLSRMHNDSNILVLGGRLTAFALATEIIADWLNTEFEGGRHLKRIDKITEYERGEHENN